MVDNRALIREFVAAWRRGDTDTARRVKEVAWTQHREHPMSEAMFRAVRTIYDVESTIPLGTPDKQPTDTEGGPNAQQGAGL